MIKIIKEGNEIPFIDFAHGQCKRPNAVYKTKLKLPTYGKSPRNLTRKASFLCPLCNEYRDKRYAQMTLNVTDGLHWYGGNYCFDCRKIINERVLRFRKWVAYYRKHVTSKESHYFTMLRESIISGICSLCGEIQIFPEYHHILGRKISDLTLSLCHDCHTSRRGKYHYISIGGRIEYGALVYD